MKIKYIVGLFILALSFNACEPLEDIYDEIDVNNVAQYQLDTFNVAREFAPEAYTLTDDDYELSSNSAIANYKNFSATALVKDYMPEILNKKFTAPADFEMLVTYNYYEKVVADEANAYEISSDEYSEMGQSDEFFYDDDEAAALMASLLDRKVYASEEGIDKTVKYVLYTKYEDRYIKVNADGTTEEVDYTADAYELVHEDYDGVGQGKYDTFYKIYNALDLMDDVATNRGDALPKVYKCVVYKNYLDHYKVYTYNGSNWEVKESLTQRTEPLSFSLNTDNLAASTWWADPAIKLTLTTSDYEVVSASSYYHNFDLRDGKDPGPDTAKLIEYIGQILDANYSAVENQQYLVTFAYYDGASGSKSIRIIKTSGVWAEASI